MDATLHGIKNCDSVKKARKWLESHGIEYQFRDFRTAAPDAAEIRGWLAHCEWQKLLNKRCKKGAEEAPEAEDASGETVRLPVRFCAASRNLLVRNNLLCTQVAKPPNGEFKHEDYSSIFPDYCRISCHRGIGIR